MLKRFNHLDLPALPKIEQQTAADGTRQYVTPDGSRLPSVTTVLGHFQKQHIVKWRKRVGEEEANKISGRASRRGTKFHKLMEGYLGNEQGFLNEADLVEQMAFKDAQKVVDRIDNIHYIEAALFSYKVGLAGSVDCIAEFDGVPSVIDFKTSSKLKDENWITSYFLQETAYSLMYEDMTGTEVKQIVTIISVDHEINPQVFIKNRSEFVPLLAERVKTYKREVLNV